MAPPATPAIERLWPKVDVGHPLGCWEWNGGTTADGYGQTTEKTPDGRRRIYVHRLAYEHLLGPIPEGLVIDHLCRNTLCVNPDHLEPVTIAENVRRGRAVEVSRARATASHGTYARYNRASDPCRCGPCAEANRAYKRAWKRRSQAA